MADVVFSVEASSISKTRTDVTVGNHVYSIDETERLGGTNTGPNPIEYMLGALAGCLNVTGHLIAKEMGFEISSMTIRLEGNLDPLVFMGKKQTVRAGYKEIRAHFELDSTASEEVLQQWAEAVELRCPVSDNVRNVTPIKITF